MREKENDTASLNSANASSYVARLQKRQALEKVRQSNVGRSVSDRLLRKSMSLVPKPGQGGVNRSNGPSGPLRQPAASAATDAVLDDAAAKLQRELDTCDRKLELLRSHMGPLSTISRPPAEPHSDYAPATSGEPSIVRQVITASGQGCKDVLAASTTASLPKGAAWKTRPHHSTQAESSCMLQLGGKLYSDVTIRITFADAASVPARLRFEHAPKPTAAFVTLGQVPLQDKSMRQLKHVFRLGPSTTVHRCLRISFAGHIAREHSGMHCVSHLLVTGTPIASTGAAMGGESSSMMSTGSAAAAGESASSAPGASPAEVPQEMEMHVSMDADGGLTPAGPAEPRGSAAKVKKAAPQAQKKAPPPPPPPPPGAMPGKRAAPPPPPPPPGAGVRRQVAPQPVAKGPAPSRPTLRLFWDKLAPRASTIQGTVWGQLSDGQASLDFAQLEEEFAAKQPAVVLKGTDKTRRPAVVAPRLLTIQRVNNVGALLARLKLSPQHAKQSLLHLLGEDEPEDSDGQVRSLSEEDVESLLQCLPNEDELRPLAAYSGPREGLTPAERFMLGVLPIPALRERMQAIVFLHGFHARTEAVAASASLVTTACGEARDSPLLRSVLRTALAIGNFLNAGNRNGAAIGFQVDSLLKLKDVRSTRARSRTLLHFLAREVSRKHPTRCSLSAELPNCRAAARISLGDLRAELDALAEGIEGAHCAGKAGGADPAQMDDLLAAATDRLAGVNGLVVEADASFLELRSFLNGKQATMDDPSAFFTLMATFCQQLDAAHGDNAAADAQAIKRGERPGSAPAMRGNNSRGNSPEAVGDAAAEREPTPPLERRDNLLATIRMYSRMTAEQRRTLLTDEGSRERLKHLGIAHRHSVAAPGMRDVLAAAGSPACASPSPSPSGSNAAAAVAPKRQSTVRASAPAISLAALVAKAEQADESRSDLAAASPAGLPPVVEEEQEEEEEQAATSLAGTVVQEDEVEEAISADAAEMSSPVARALAASRNLMQSINLRCSTEAASTEEVIPEHQEQEEEKDEENGECAETQVDNDAYDTLPLDYNEEEEEEEGRQEGEYDDLRSSGSGVTLGRVALGSPQAPTPQVSWANRARRREAYAEEAEGAPFESLTESLDASSGQLHLIRRSGVSERTPSVELLGGPAELGCSVHMQPVHGARVWESVATGLDAGDEEENWDAASVATSEGNPMMSAPNSPRYDDLHLDGRYSGCGGEIDKVETAAEMQRNEEHQQDGGGAVRRSAAGILQGSTEWVRRAEQQDGGNVRASKRVSFSLTNSPRGSDQSQKYEEEAEIPLKAQQEPLRRSVQSASAVPGPAFDLGLAAQLVANADRVRRSWQPEDHCDDQPAMLQGALSAECGNEELQDGSCCLDEVVSAAVAAAPEQSSAPSASLARMPVEQRAAYILSKALAAEMRLSLPGLPGVPSDTLPGLPLALNTGDIDEFMAAVIANAGNTPTGPLAQGVRGGDEHLFDGEGADALRQAARERAATFAPPRKALLEPIIPAPLGMGVRASETVAHGLSPCTLRQSLEAHLSLRPPVSRAGPSSAAAYTNTTVAGAAAAPLQEYEEEFEVQGALYEGEEEQGQYLEEELMQEEERCEEGQEWSQQPEAQPEEIQQEVYEVPSRQQVGVSQERQRRSQSAGPSRADMQVAASHQSLHRSVHHSIQQQQQQQAEDPHPGGGTPENWDEDGVRWSLRVDALQRREVRKVHSSLAQERMSMWESYSAR